MAPMANVINALLVYMFVFAWVTHVIGLCEAKSPGANYAKRGLILGMLTTLMVTVIIIGLPETIRYLAPCSWMLTALLWYVSGVYMPARALRQMNTTHQPKHE